MATNFSPCKGSYVLNQFPSNVMFGMNGFHVSASGAIQGHHGPLVFIYLRYEREEAFTALNLTVKNATLQDSLDQFVKGELLEGDNAYYCEKCAEKVCVGVFV